MGERIKSAIISVCPHLPRPPRSKNRFLATAVLFYQHFLRSHFSTACRFYPSCSHYALDAVHTHSSGYALYLIARRLLRCRPWGPTGYDPVPTKTSRLKQHYLQVEGNV